MLITLRVARVILLFATKLHGVIVWYDIVIIGMLV